MVNEIPDTQFLDSSTPSVSSIWKRKFKKHFTNNVENEPNNSKSNETILFQCYCLIKTSRNFKKGNFFLTSQRLCFYSKRFIKSYLRISINLKEIKDILKQNPNQIHIPPLFFIAVLYTSPFSKNPEGPNTISFAFYQNRDEVYDLIINTLYSKDNSNSQIHSHSTETKKETEPPDHTTKKKKNISFLVNGNSAQEEKTKNPSIQIQRRMTWGHSSDIVESLLHTQHIQEDLPSYSLKEKELLEHLKLSASTSNASNESEKGSDHVPPPSSFHVNRGSPPSLPFTSQRKTPSPSPLLHSHSLSSIFNDSNDSKATPILNSMSSPSIKKITSTSNSNDASVSADTTHDTLHENTSLSLSDKLSLSHSSKVLNSASSSSTTSTPADSGLNFIATTNSLSKVLEYHFQNKSKNRNNEQLIRSDKQRTTDSELDTSSCTPNKVIFPCVYDDFTLVSCKMLIGKTGLEIYEISNLSSSASLIQKTIPFDQILAVQKTNTISLPNSIEIVCSNNEHHLLGHLADRNDVYSIIVEKLLKYSLILPETTTKYALEEFLTISSEETENPIDLSALLENINSFLKEIKLFTFKGHSIYLNNDSSLSSPSSLVEDVHPLKTTESIIQEEQEQTKKEDYSYNALFSFMKLTTLDFVLFFILVFLFVCIACCILFNVMKRFFLP